MPALPISSMERDEAAQIWALECWFEKKPTAAQKRQLAALFVGDTPEITSEKLPETDWIAEGQKGTEPIQSGRFYIHTPDHPASTDAKLVNFQIPAAQAFGTGHHETTAGCLAMLDAMHGLGLRPRNIIDVGTGTGLLAFAAGALWPRARLTASDLDPVCEPAVLGNARDNGVALGIAPGQLAMTIADGLEDRLLIDRAPYDLLIANILAGPLIAMAPDFASALAARGSIVLAGLLNSQAAGIIRAYREAGLRLQHRLVKGDWTILWLRQNGLA